MKAHEAFRMKEVLEKKVDEVERLAEEFRDSKNKEKGLQLDRETARLNKLAQLAEEILNSQDRVKNLIIMAELENLVAEVD